MPVKQAVALMCVGVFAGCQLLQHADLLSRPPRLRPNAHQGNQSLHRQNISHGVMRQSVKLAGVDHHEISIPATRQRRCNHGARAAAMKRTCAAVGSPWSPAEGPGHLPSVNETADDAQDVPGSIQVSVTWCAAKGVVTPPHTMQRGPPVCRELLLTVRLPAVKACDCVHLSRFAFGAYLRGPEQHDKFSVQVISVFTGWLLQST